MERQNMFHQEKEYKELADLSEKIGAMLWGIIAKLKNQP